MTNIYVISPEELFATLIKNKELFENGFYDFDSKVFQPSELILNGYNKVVRIRKDNEYIESDDFIFFLRKDGFFYSAEFGALVVSTHYWKEDNELEEMNKIQKVLRDINSD